jgi:hypothetical protein
LTGADTPAAQDATPLSLGAAAPHTVIDAVGQCVLEAIDFHRAVVADSPSAVDADAVRWEELTRSGLATAGLQHPTGCPVVGVREHLIHRVHVFNDRR